MAVLWHIHCKKFLKTDSVNRLSCSDYRYNADSHLCCGLTACLLTTLEKAITPEKPPAPAVTFPTSHQTSGQTVWMELVSGSAHPAHTQGDRHSPSGAAEVGNWGCSCQRHSSSPTPGKCKAPEQCDSVSPAPHTCLLFSFCLTHMFLASSLLWQSLRFRSWVSQGQERLNCTEPQPEDTAGWIVALDMKCDHLLVRSALEWYSSRKCRWFT